MRVYIPYAGTQEGVLNLSIPAPVGGLDVALVVDSVAVATCPASAHFEEGEIACRFTITWVSAGTTHVDCTYAGVTVTLDITCMAYAGALASVSAYAGTYIGRTVVCRNLTGYPHEGAGPAWTEDPQCVRLTADVLRNYHGKPLSADMAWYMEINLLYETTVMEYGLVDLTKAHTHVNSGVEGTKIYTCHDLLTSWLSDGDHIMLDGLYELIVDKVGTADGLVSDYCFHTSNAWPAVGYDPAGKALGPDVVTTFRVFDPLTGELVHKRDTATLCDSHVAGLYQITPDPLQTQRPTGNRGRFILTWLGEADDSPPAPGHWKWNLETAYTLGGFVHDEIVATGFIDVLPPGPLT
jgi:hypothetical protein